MPLHFPPSTFHFLPSTIQQERDGSIIDEVDLHPGLKFPRLDRDVLFLQSKDESFVEVSGKNGVFCFCKRGSSSLPAVAIEGELGDDQHLSIDFP